MLGSAPECFTSACAVQSLVTAATGCLLLHPALLLMRLPTILHRLVRSSSSLGQLLNGTVCQASRTNTAKAVDGNTQLLLCRESLLVASALGLYVKRQTQQASMAAMLGQMSKVCLAQDCMAGNLRTSQTVILTAFSCVLTRSAHDPLLCTPSIVSNRMQRQCWATDHRVHLGSCDLSCLFTPSVHPIAGETGPAGLVRYSDLLVNICSLVVHLGSYSPL